jgi:hypothetical protein
LEGEVVLLGLGALFLLLLALLQGQTLASVGEHVEHVRELAVVVELDLPHGVEVELEALEMQDHRVRELLDAGPLQSVDVLLARLAEVRVVALQHITSHIQLQRLDHTALNTNNKE